MRSKINVLQGEWSNIYIFFFYKYQVKYVCFFAKSSTPHPHKNRMGRHLIETYWHWRQDKIVVWKKDTTIGYI